MEWYQILSAGGTIIAIIAAIVALVRNGRHDNEKDTAQLTTVIVKLENIGTGITEIKSELSNVKTDMQNLRDRLIITEQSVKSAHKRIDGIEGKDGK